MFEQVRCILCGNDFSCIVWFVSPFPAFFGSFFPRVRPSGQVGLRILRSGLLSQLSDMPHASAMRFIRKCVWCRDACTHTWWLFCQLTPFVWGVEMLGSCKSVASHKSEYTVMWSWYLWHVTIEIIPFYIYKIVWIHVIKLKKLLNHGFFFVLLFGTLAFQRFWFQNRPQGGDKWTFANELVKVLLQYSFEPET